MSLIEKEFKNGELIVKEGDIGKSFFQVLEGSVGVYAGFGKNDQIKLAVLEAGEFFGEMAILESYPRSATVVARGTVRVIEIPEDDLEAYFTENPDMILELMRHLINRVAAMANDYNDSQVLVNQLRESEAAKQSKSLFSKIKKHIDIYQSNKNKISEPAEENLREAFAALKDDDSKYSKSYRKGLILFKEGDEGSCMYILREGEIGMYSNYRHREEEKLAGYNAVSFFGELGMLDGQIRNATAVSESNDTVVEIIRPEELEDVFRACPGKITLILRHLSYRLRRINIDFLNVCKEITELYNKK